MSIGEFTIAFFKKMFKTKTDNFRALKRCISLEGGEERDCYVIQQHSIMVGWGDLTLVHTHLACGKSRRKVLPLSFYDKKEAEKEIDKIEKRLPSIIEKVFQGDELDRIVREIRTI